MRIPFEDFGKRRYSAPTLRLYGTMASLTKTGSGSCVGEYHYKRRKRKKRPWECDDD